MLATENHPTLKHVPLRAHELTNSHKCTLIQKLYIKKETIVAQKRQARSRMFSIHAVFGLLETPKSSGTKCFSWKHHQEEYISLQIMVSVAG